MGIAKSLVASFRYYPPLQNHNSLVLQPGRFLKPPLPMPWTFIHALLLLVALLLLLARSNCLNRHGYTGYHPQHTGICYFYNACDGRKIEWETLKRFEGVMNEETEQMWHSTTLQWHSLNTKCDKRDTWGVAGRVHIAPCTWVGNDLACWRPGWLGTNKNSSA